jgi:putative intracellular protease/amidase
LRPEEVAPADYEAIFYAGGHGVMSDFPTNARLIEIACDIYETAGLVAAAPS